ncbi:MAG: MalT transcriptional regulator family protein, partial [Anaerolineae bacterium]
MADSDPLIRTKLRPPSARAGLVTRPRLQEQVLQGLHGPLTLIIAPAGFGKTTLAAACAASCGLPVAWLSLDKDDDRVERFLRYLVAAVQAADAHIGVDAARMLAGMQRTPVEAVLTSLVNDLDSNGLELVLALEDYQFISSQAVHEAVAFLLEHCPNNLHLLIAARSDPPLPLARLRARGQITELRASDLRFTKTEALQFLNDSMGLHLDSGAVAVLEERTEGWIAGLQMAALSMRGRDDVTSFIREFAGTNRFIMDFMLEEVLAHEPLEVQDFMLKTSILTRLSGPLCDAVVGACGGQEMLEFLEKRSIFIVPLDDERRWYRYHHLFADLLQARLVRSGAEQVDQLLLRASCWCEQEGQIAEAITYALQAQEYRRAGDLIAKYWHFTANIGGIETVWGWLQALPEELIKNDAQLGLAYCWELWLKGQTAAIAPHLEDAEAAMQREVANGNFDQGTTANAVLPAHLAVLRSIVSRSAHDYAGAIAHAERALQFTPANLPSEAYGQLHTVTFVALATAYDGAGEIAKAVDAYYETIRWSRLAGNPAGLCGMTHWLIGALWNLGRLKAADQAGRDALHYLEEHNMAHLPVAGLLHIRL